MNNETDSFATLIALTKLGATLDEWAAADAADQDAERAWRELASTGRYDNQLMIDWHYAEKLQLDLKAQAQGLRLVAEATSWDELVLFDELLADSGLTAVEVVQAMIVNGVLS